jgi:myo-inositol-1(or 4)-monophosphatase
VVAGNPKVYAQLVSILAPYTRVVEPAAAPQLNSEPEDTPEAALLRTGTPAQAVATMSARTTVRVRKGEAG